MSDSQQVSESEADELLATGAWVVDSEVILTYDKQIRQILSAWFKGSDEERLRDGGFFKNLTDIAQVSYASMIETEERAKVITKTWAEAYAEAHRQFPNARFKIVTRRPFIIFKVAPTIMKTRLSMISLASTFIAAMSLDGGSAALLLGRSIRDIHHVVKSLIESWEKITDPVEEAVLREICQFHAIGVVNYDKLRSKKFDEAYGSLAPTSADIVQRIQDQCHSGQLPHLADYEGDGGLRAAVIRALASLRERDILQKDGDRWKVVF